MTTTPQVTRSFSADYEAMRSLGPWLAAEMPRLGCPPELIERTGEIELALHELAVNTIDHAIGIGQGELTIEMEYDGEASELAVVCRDRGEAFDVEAWPAAPQAPQVRGYGLMIIEQLASSIEYRRVDESNEWLVTFDG